MTLPETDSVCSNEENICKICQNKNNEEEYVLKEMMFGTREPFTYFKCDNCGCLQIKHFPENMEKYYPADYLSFSKVELPPLKKYFLKIRDQYSFTGKGFLGKCLTKIFGYADFFPWFTNAGLTKDSLVLDVGSGKGDLLLKLQSAGFNNLLGIDPLIQEDIIYGNNLKILKKNLFELKGFSFDFIMFHHVFEHLPNPNETMEYLKNILKENGIILIRIPLIDSYAWEFYKTDWVQLDPPRHYFLHSLKSIEYLAEKHRFKIDRVVFDSTSFQFWGSEQYRMQIPLMNSNSYFINHRNSAFTRNDIKKFEVKSKELNKNNKGDTACFYLKNLP